MTPAAMAQTLIRNAHRKHTHPNVPFIAEATGLPEAAVSDLAAMERPTTPGWPAGPTPAPDPSAGDASPDSGPAGFHHVTCMHHIPMTDGSLLVFVGCRCGDLLRARVQELPRHWRRHTEGLL